MIGFLKNNERVLFLYRYNSFMGGYYYFVKPTDKNFD